MHRIVAAKTKELVVGFTWKSFGAHREVTGSCHLIEYGGKRILIDCGIFQGKNSRGRNEPPFPFDPASIDAVVVTHGHLDHIGRLPLLVREGFEGRLLSSRATFELARLSLADSLAIMANDTRRENRRRRRSGESEMVEPLYNEEDIFETIQRWDSHLEYGQTQTLFEGIDITSQDAGHILGSSSLLFDLSGDGDNLCLAISGDLGGHERLLARGPAPGPKADIAVVESTYGDRDHRSQSDSIDELVTVICETFERDGNVVIPTFALERAQELLYLLHQAWSEEEIPEKTRIFLDSPDDESGSHLRAKGAHRTDVSELQPTRVLHSSLRRPVGGESCLDLRRPGGGPHNGSHAVQICSLETLSPRGKPLSIEEASLGITNDKQ